MTLRDNSDNLTAEQVDKMLNSITCVYWTAVKDYSCSIILVWPLRFNKLLELTFTIRKFNECHINTCGHMYSPRIHNSDSSSYTYEVHWWQPPVWRPKEELSSLISENPKYSSNHHQQPISNQLPMSRLSTDIFFFFQQKNLHSSPNQIIDWFLKIYRLLYYNTTTHSLCLYFNFLTGVHEVGYNYRI